MDAKVSEKFEDENKKDVDEAKKHKSIVKSYTAIEAGNEPNNDIFKTALKGSKLDENGNTMCLDCGKVFVQRASYLLHSRL